MKSLPFSFCLLLTFITGPAIINAQEPERKNPVERAIEARDAADANAMQLNPVLEQFTSESLEADESLDYDAIAEEETSTDESSEATGDSATAEAPATPVETTTVTDQPTDTTITAPQPAAIAVAPMPETPPLETFDLNYVDTPIRTILRYVADAADLNVIIPDTLVGSISIQLKKVTWPQVFDIALDGTGFVWVKGDAGIIRIQRVGADQAIEVAENGLVSVNFRSEPTRSAVQALAEVVGLNIIIPADLEGNTSASLSNVTWERVLTSILEENNYQWFEDEGIIGIRQVDSRVVLDLQSGGLNLNLRETPFQDVATLIGQTQTPVVNVVSPPEIENLLISLEVQGVTFDQALDLSILKLPKVPIGGTTGDGAQQFQSYSTYRQGENLVQIVDSQFMQNLRNEPPVVRIYDLRYASAGDLLLRIMPSPGDTSETSNGPIPSFRQASNEVLPVVSGVQSVAADHANNLLIVTARPASLQEVGALLERLDQPLKQILIESKFVEITGQDQKNLGVDWASLSGFGINAGPFTREWSRGRTQNDTNTTTNTTGRNFSDTTTRSFIDNTTFNSSNGFDRNNNNIVNNGANNSSSNTSTFTDNNGVITTTDTSNSSNSNAFSNDSDSQNNNFNNQSTDVVRQSGTTRDITNSSTSSNLFQNTIENIATTARLDSAIFSTDQFRLVLRALEEESDAKLITNPNVVAINGKQARVELTDYFYKPGVVETSDGVTTRGEPLPLEPRPGTTLEVTPTVVGGQLIALKVIPQVNSVVGEQTIDGNTIPTVRRRATDSEVLLRSGSTLAIGGLITDENVTNNTKVPILGDIPILGRLFSSESTNVQTTNQIIFITASLLNPQSNTYMDVVGIDRFNAMGLTDREVQGVGARELSPEELQLQQAVRRARNEAANQELLDALRLREQAEDSKIKELEEPLVEPEETDQSESGPRKFGPVSRR